MISHILSILLQGTLYTILSKFLTEKLVLGLGAIHALYPEGVTLGLA